eukprot:3484864-Rhodomonas_salina.3
MSVGSMTAEEGGRRAVTCTCAPRARGRASTAALPPSLPRIPSWCSTRMGREERGGATWARVSSRASSVPVSSSCPRPSPRQPCRPSDRGEQGAGQDLLEAAPDAELTERGAEAPGVDAAEVAVEVEDALQVLVVQLQPHHAHHLQQLVQPEALCHAGAAHGLRDARFDHLLGGVAAEGVGEALQLDAELAELEEQR